MCNDDVEDKGFLHNPHKKEKKSNAPDPEANLTPEQKMYMDQMRKIEEQDSKEVEYRLEDGKKFINDGGKAKINYESQGRFDLPPAVSFKNYNIRQLNDIALARNDDLLEIMLKMLQDNCSDSNVDVGDMTLDELYETMIGIEVNFRKDEAIKHLHRWVCDCQKTKGEDEEIIPSSQRINITNMKYRSIEEADNGLREIYREVFKSMKKKEFSEYLKRKYSTVKDAEKSEAGLNHSIEDEVKTIKIHEPISLIGLDGTVHRFRYPRARDLVVAFRLACQKNDGKIKMIRNRQEHGVPGDELKAKKQREINAVNSQKARDTVLFARALSLIESDGKELSTDQKIKIFSDLGEEVQRQLNEIINVSIIGVNDEREFTCDLCGKVERRSLQQSFNPIEFVPIGDDSQVSADGKLRKPTAINFYFGT